MQLKFDRRASARRAGDEPIARVADLALDETDPQPPLLDPSLGRKLPRLDRPHVLYLQIHRREILTRIEHPAKGNPHRRIGQRR